ncbi:MAG: hypothetical protein IT190_06290 [Microbacteriaceae bacterium]|nr:hypothetical protein [Microbacteriaceae bacterium]
MPQLSETLPEAVRMRMIRAQYDLDLDRIFTAVRKFNSNTTLTATDFLLHQHFDGIRRSLDAATVAHRVALLDGLWATRLFLQAGVPARIVESLNTHRPMLVAMLETLPPDALEDNPVHIIATARAVLPVILRHSAGDSERYRQNYSFASKFFHWVTREHFPIVDSRARRHINRLQTHAGASQRVRSTVSAKGRIDYVADYECWVGFYSDLIAGLAQADRRALLRADYDFLPHGSRVRNSLLRVLDKGFYVLGEGGGPQVLPAAAD